MIESHRPNCCYPSNSHLGRLLTPQHRVGVAPLHRPPSKRLVPQELSPPLAPVQRESRVSLPRHPLHPTPVPQRSRQTVLPADRPTSRTPPCWAIQQRY